MPRLRAWHGAQSLSIHSDWMSVWAPDLRDQSLRRALWGNPRLSSRISENILRERFDQDATPPAVPDNAIIIEAVIQAGAHPNWTRQLGLRWVAPVLAGKLLNSQTRSSYGSISKAEIEHILEARDHSAPAQIGPVLDGTDIATQGALCVEVWLASLPTALACRVRLLLPPLAAVEISEPSERTAARLQLMIRTFKDDPEDTAI